MDGNSSLDTFEQAIAVRGGGLFTRGLINKSADG